MELVSTESGVWRKRLRIHSYDVDFRKRATAEALCRSFLEAAWNHAEQLGIGYNELSKQDQLWVLARLLVQVDRYPEWGDQVTLATWPRGTRGVFAQRDFEFLDAEGRCLGAGASSWIVLDATTHRPQRIDKLLLRIPTRSARMALDREPGKLQHFETNAVTLTTTARYSDVDVNRHVNSARYIGWLLDSYSPDFHRVHSLRSWEVNYVGETLWAETVLVCSQEQGPLEFSHSIVRPDRSELCRADLKWRVEADDKPLSSSSALQ
jgi:medium-chain acyl-[acyl-carrier-protein] hydrolase